MIDLAKLDACVAKLDSLDKRMDARNELIGDNPQEEAQGVALIKEATREANRFKVKAYDIAGNFRGPGLWNRVKQSLRSVD